jgi:two-component system, chemotaxis family, protein-glutamate methylesterase/glutaminase
MPAIRVLIVDDSALARRMLARALEPDSGIEVVGVAKDGVEALERLRDLAPDVVTLDIAMPGIDGLEVLRRIVRDSEARVVMLSSVDDPQTTYAALEAGAIDFIPKPSEGLASSMKGLSKRLGRAIRTASRVPADKVRSVSQLPAGARAPFAGPSIRAGGDPTGLVVIAASTGGPPALETVFRDLPQNGTAAFAVVQHLPAGFTGSLADRLGRAAGFPVTVAYPGVRLEPGQGYVAPHGSHMRVVRDAAGGTRALLTREPPVHGVRPAADPLFESASATFGPRTVGVVLTGMGTDGAKGLLAIRDAGGMTVAQDEETSVVWGMPGAAVRLDAARAVVPLARVGHQIRRALEAWE